MTSHSVQPGCRAAARCVVPGKSGDHVVRADQQQTGRSSAWRPPRTGFALRLCPLRSGAPDAQRAAAMLVPVAFLSVLSLLSSPGCAHRPLPHRDRRMPVSPTPSRATAPGHAAFGPPPSGTSSHEAPLLKARSVRRTATGSPDLHVYRSTPSRLSHPTTARSPTLGGHPPLRIRLAGRFQRSTVSQPLRHPCMPRHSGRRLPSGTSSPQSTPSIHRSGPCLQEE